ncbi:hypothetical protein PG985_015814 [Apiospora marii]|uniref:Uncharacterized protein n=1 Tax=Apiospora marii TaxID=335849 RepID=A0ABR1S6K8_9PEZI
MTGRKRTKQLESEPIDAMMMTVRKKEKIRESDINEKPNRSQQAASSDRATGGTVDRDAGRAGSPGARGAVGGGCSRARARARTRTAHGAVVGPGTTGAASGLAAGRDGGPAVGRGRIPRGARGPGAAPAGGPVAGGGVRAPVHRRGDGAPDGRGDGGLDVGIGRAVGAGGGGARRGPRAVVGAREGRRPRAAGQDVGAAGRERGPAEGVGAVSVARGGSRGIAGRLGSGKVRGGGGGGRGGPGAAQDGGHGLGLGALVRGPGVLLSVDLLEYTLLGRESLG